MRIINKELKKEEVKRIPIIIKKNLLSLLPPKNKGFTIVELLITIIIFMILVVVTLPSIVRSLKQREIVEATQSFIDLVDFAKVQAFQRNRAYGIVVQLGQGSNGSNGIVRVHESPTSGCINFGTGFQNVRVLDYSVEFQSVKIKDIIPANLDNNILCFRPDGKVVRADTQMPVQPSIEDSALYSAGDAIVRFRRITSTGVEEGVIHEVRIPYNGIPRITFSGE